MNSTKPSPAGTGQAFVVSDLGFGDGGKGLITDYLVGQQGAGAVLRWHGGAQAGHNVVTPDGRHHCFSQLGAGAFHPNVLTLHGPAMVVHPTALGVEAECLRRQGVDDALARLRLHRRSRVITPFHQAAGRLRELLRGAHAHGTCGTGFGETIADDLAQPALTLRVEDLAQPARCRRTLLRIRAWKQRWLAPLQGALASLPGAAPELAIFATDAVVDRWLESAYQALQGVVQLDNGGLARALASSGTVVLEGAQGLLLDELHGFFPHTTWSDCRMQGGVELLAQLGYRGRCTRVGVIRSYLTRHGPGPLPTEHHRLNGIPEPHNTDQGWQGAFRKGFPDLVLLRYAAAVGGRPDVLAVTHLDVLAQRSDFQMADAYQLGDGRLLEDLRQLIPSSPSEAEHLHRMQTAGELLAQAVPRYLQLPADPKGRAERCLTLMGHATGARRFLVAAGPTAGDVRPVAWPPNSP